MTKNRLSVAWLMDFAGNLSFACIAVITALVSLFFAFGERSAFNEQSAKHYRAWFFLLTLLQLEFVIIYILVSG
ncbi:MAG: hypothetical protein HPY75_15035 [Actinobacteria bacterium]|nr:hypothetical protein [Actinomycetota bacterium]